MTIFEFISRLCQVVVFVLGTRLPATGVSTLGPSGPKSKRSLKMSPRGLSAQGGPKVQNGVENESKSTIFYLFQLVFDSILDFLDPRGREALGTHFQTFFRLWAQRAQSRPL